MVSKIKVREFAENLVSPFLDAGWMPQKGGIERQDEVIFRPEASVPESATAAARSKVCKPMEDPVTTSNKWMVFAATLAGVPCAANAQGLVTERTLSVDAAQEAAAAALAQCRKDGMRVTVTVLDHAGRTKVMLRDDGANPHTVEHSLRKAYTALTYRTPSGEYGKRAASRPTAAGPLHLDKITTAAGGIPIRAGNEWVGSIGISGSPGVAGSPGGAKDEACAQAGIDRIAKVLAGN